MGCLRSARFNMRATLLRTATNPTPGETAWHWEWVQDPESGTPIQVRVEDDVTTPDVDEALAGTQQFDVMARGVIDGGIRVAGTTETFDEVYTATDWVKITYPASVKITRRDKVTNIRHYDGGPIIWVEEENDNAPTIFNVKGITPVVDLFGKHVENFALLERAEVQ